MKPLQESIIGKKFRPTIENKYDLKEGGCGNISK